jgi:hypothetical protein
VLVAAPELVRETVMEIPQTGDAFDCCEPFETTTAATSMRMHHSALFFASLAAISSTANR